MKAKCFAVVSFDFSFPCVLSERERVRACVCVRVPARACVFRVTGALQHSFKGGVMSTHTLFIYLCAIIKNVQSSLQGIC